MREALEREAAAVERVRILDAELALMRTTSGSPPEQSYMPTATMRSELTTGSGAPERRMTLV